MDSLYRSASPFPKTGFGNGIFFQAIEEGISSQAQQARSLALVSAALMQCLLQQVPFQFIQPDSIVWQLEAM